MDTIVVLQEKCQHKFKHGYIMTIKLYLVVDIAIQTTDEEVGANLNCLFLFVGLSEYSNPVTKNDLRSAKTHLNNI